MPSPKLSWTQHGPFMWSLTPHPGHVPAVVQVRRRSHDEFHVLVGSPKQHIATFPTLKEAQNYGETYAELVSES